MAESPAHIDLPKDFSGQVRLFPLPNFVLFPGGVQPLHIFEPRYCELLEDALAGDRLIATATLKPGWEEDYEGRPPVEPTICIGRVMTHAQEGQRYNILLAGLCRAGIVRELPSTRSFRSAEVEVLEDLYPVENSATRSDLRRRLVSVFRSFLPATSEAQKQFDQLLMGDVSLGQLTDIVASTLSLDAAFKSALLAECNVDQRAKMLAEKLAAVRSDASSPRPKFFHPPDFSDN